MVEEYEKTGDLLVDLGSDQTSCHDPFNGGYYPVQVKDAKQIDCSFKFLKRKEGIKMCYNTFNYSGLTKQRD